MGKIKFFGVLAYAFLALGLCALAYLYFRGDEWPMLYGTLLHKLSRLHVFFVHLTVGCLLLVISLEIFMAWGGEKKTALTALRWNFHGLTHVLTLICLYSGLTMDLIERYPNPLIRNHLIGGLLSYVGLLVISGICWRGIWGKWRLAPLLIFTLIVCGSSHLVC